MFIKRTTQYQISINVLKFGTRKKNTRGPIWTIYLCCGLINFRDMTGDFVHIDPAYNYCDARTWKQYIYIYIYILYIQINRILLIRFDVDNSYIYIYIFTHINSIFLIQFDVGKFTPIIWHLYTMRSDYHQWPLLLTWFNLIPAWISNHMPGKVWGEITYPFIAQIAPLSFQGSHRTQTQTSEVRWPARFSGHQHVCISNSRETFTEATKENLKWKTFTT